MADSFTALLDVLSSPGGALRSFPKKDGVRAAFLAAARALCAALHARKVEVKDEATLLVKLGLYAGKRQWAVEALPVETLADAIAARPASLGTLSPSFSKLLKLHDVHNRQAAAALRRELLANPDSDAAPALMAKSPDKAYRLVECLTQRHLKEETAELGHCVGGENLAHYAGRMASGETRIFSLRTARNTPCVTIEYDVKSGDIMQMEGNPRRLFGKEPFFPALCETLAQLDAQIGVRKIKGLPVSGHSTAVLLRSGRWYEGKEGFAPEDVLCGEIVVTDDMSLDRLHALCQSPRVRLDVTDLDLARLPERVACDLTTDSYEFVAPHLREAETIWAQRARYIDLPELLVADSLCFSSATELNVPKLETAGDIKAYQLISFEAPRLRESHGLHFAHCLEALVVPLLQRAWDINAPHSETFFAPELKVAEDVLVGAFRGFEARQLREVTSLIVRDVKRIDLPSLEKAGSIILTEQGEIYAPRLREPVNTKARIVGVSASSDGTLVPTRLVSVTGAMRPFGP